MENPWENVTSETSLDWQQVTTNISQLNCSVIDNNNTQFLNGCPNEAVEETYYVLPWGRKCIWTILFVAMAITSTFGNLIVIWIVMSQKRMRTVTNYFIVNLSIADTMVSSLNVTFNYVYMLNGHWPFGNIYCKLCSFISIISVCASVFTLVAISTDRYNAIIRPLKPRMGRPMTILVAVLIWIVAMIIALPEFIFRETAKFSGSDATHCVSRWPDGPMNQSKGEFVYNVSFMILTYFLPMAVMTALYAAIGRELWGQKAIGEATAVQVESIKSKRRIVKMMIMVVLIFGVCWMPYHAYFIVSHLVPEINFSVYIQEIYLAIYWLAMSNSMYNPMIYCFMNNRFRQGFLSVFHFFCRIPRSQPTNETYQMGAINHGSRHPAGRHRNATRGHNQQNLLPGDGAGSQRPSSVTSLNWNNSRSPNNSVLETTVRMNGNAVSTNLAPNNSSNGQKLSVNAKMENNSLKVSPPENNISGSGFESQISTVSNNKDPPQIAL